MGFSYTHLETQNDAVSPKLPMEPHFSNDLCRKYNPKASTTLKQALSRSMGFPTPLRKPKNDFIFQYLQKAAFSEASLQKIKL